jgi:hypothetical protein
MLIGFDGEAHEDYQDAVDRLEGYGVTLTLLSGVEVEATLVGADMTADDAATILYVEAIDGDYVSLQEIKKGQVQRAVVTKIQVA